MNLTNRGVKTQNLIVLNRTVMPAILVECLFADSNDANIYNPDIIARAIVSGLVGAGSNGEWYVFDSRGYSLEDAWYYDSSDGFWYYLDGSCKMVRDVKDKPFWVWIDSGCYAFNEHGGMYCNCVTPDGWRVDETGAWVR